MKEAFEAGNPSEFCSTFEEYDVIRRNWPVLEAILSSPEGAALVAPGSYDGLIAVMAEDDDE